MLQRLLHASATRRDTATNKETAAVIQTIKVLPFGQLLKTFLFSQYQCVQRIRSFLPWCAIQTYFWHWHWERVPIWINDRHIC